MFNGESNDSYIIEYTPKEDCPSHYIFENIFYMNKKFDEATISDLVFFGKEHFESDDFEIEFNNEIVYSLIDEEKSSVKEFFANMNLLSVKDIKDGDKILKMNNFHRLNSNSELFFKLADKKLTELKIPYNDIVTLRKGFKEIHFGFEKIDVFK